jgi:GNAT superfamily N-acetyltransferase
MAEGAIHPRVAASADVEPIVATLTGAFEADPVWSWAFPDRRRRAAQYATWFGLFVESALPHGWVWTLDGCAAVSVWTPPGNEELSEAAEARLEPFLTSELGDNARPVLQVMEQFESACPAGRDFYYLSWLGTRPDHRGHGLGMKLLAANLARIDAEGAPAYLESTNPANDARYERLGFAPLAKFSAPDDGPTVTTMWREPSRG